MAWRFEPGEELRHAFRRVSAEEIAEVRGLLQGPEGERERAIHEARQAFKRLRALARLAEPSLGTDFAAENRRWRDAGRMLSGSRDTTVLLQCFDSIARDRPGHCPTAGIKRLRTRIAAGGRNGAHDIEAELRKVLDLLDQAAASLDALAWPDGRGALLDGFRQGQKRLRRDWKKACKHRLPDALHAWRKRIKEQAAQLRLFRGVLPAKFRSRIGSEKETAEILGDTHDLWLLGERLRSFALPADLLAVRDGLLQEIEARRIALDKKALKKGRPFSSQKAKDLAKALGSAFDAASRQEARRARKREDPDEPRPAPISPRP